VQKPNNYEVGVAEPLPFCKSPETGTSIYSRLDRAVCSVSSNRLQNHWWPSRCTRLNTNSWSFQSPVLMPAYH